MTATASVSTGDSGTGLPWLFSPRVDLLTFGGSAALALGLVALGFRLNLIDRATPEWTWVTTILLIDVAHVYATGFRVYFDRSELSQRPWLYTLTPLLTFLLGLAVYSESSRLFWQLLAYLAVFHFVRQQYGWVALYRAREGDSDRFGRFIDSAAVYLATIYPLIYWHAHLPREFWWFEDVRFLELPALAATITAPLYWGALLAYAIRAGYRAVHLRRFNPGKDLVVASTAICWYVGIVALNSDYAFTVTNVIIHGVPYMVLVYWFWQRGRSVRPARPMATGLLWFVGTIWVLAYAEELLWDRAVWQRREWLFGSAWHADEVQVWLVPLLAVPQVTHYVLDGFIWRRRSSRRVAGLAEPVSRSSS